MNFSEIQHLERIILFDGECGFCNKSIQFILKNQKKTVYFLPLQSPVAKRILSKNKVKLDMSTLFYLEKGKLYSRSSAVVKILQLLKGGYPALSYLLYVVPVFIRDYVYAAIAKRRHKISAKNCLLPTVEEREFFL